MPHPTVSADSTPTPAERARRLIDVGVNMTVATIGLDGAPWVSPVFYVPDENYDLYWTSEPRARHSENIRASGTAAIVIVEPDPHRRVDAVYISAESVELTRADEIARAMTVMTRKPQPERWMITHADDVSEGGPWRIYRAHPLTIEVRASATEGDKAVARRQPADFRAA